LPCCPVRARTCRPRGLPSTAGWPGGWADAGRWRCPPLGRGRPDWVQTHRLGGHLEAVTLNWGVRTVERSAMSGARPATAGCPQEELIGGDGVQGVSGGRTLVEAGGQPDCGHVRHAMARSSRCPPDGPGLGAPVDERLRRRGLFPRPIGPTDEGGAGGSAGIGERLLSVGAGGPGGGFCSTSVVSRRGQGSGVLSG
jgi:hypothetical protein